MAHKQLFVIVMLIAFANLATAQSRGGACCANTVPNDSKNCGSPCPPTCENQDTSGQPCITLCLTTGCSCAPGYVRRTDLNSDCILPSQCSR